MSHSLVPFCSLLSEKFRLGSTVKFSSKQRAFMFILKFQIFAGDITSDSNTFKHTPYFYYKFQRLIYKKKQTTILNFLKRKKRNYAFFAF